MINNNINAIRKELDDLIIDVEEENFRPYVLKTRIERLVIRIQDLAREEKIKELEEESHNIIINFHPYEGIANLKNIKDRFNKIKILVNNL
ncbi:hypothetical protein [Desulfosporosinus nitroreducens]|uniref:hypothetical protein n=1 Tax=Desulfosporosinus nitroreducens TaxID=2018668 RepID=UPI00207D0544|nr:hypothetical protein [Desulfosporosinus nitroreducens]MCO1600016.1 hypothetical protein [Desulfosporosinus nitroreducens]